MHKILIGFCSTATLSRSLPQCLACLARSYFRHRQLRRGQGFRRCLSLLFGKSEHSEGLRSGVVGEIDLCLIALVLYIFSFGIYELFISEIEELKQSKQSPRNARSANSRISLAKLSSSLRSAAFGSFCVKISPRGLRSSTLRPRFGALCAMASTEGFCELKISLQILPPRHT